MAEEIKIKKKTAKRPPPTNVTVGVFKGFPLRGSCHEVTDEVCRAMLLLALSWANTFAFPPHPPRFAQHLPLKGKALKRKNPDTFSGIGIGTR